MRISLVCQLVSLNLNAAAHGRFAGIEGGPSGWRVTDERTNKLAFV